MSIRRYLVLTLLSIIVLTTFAAAIRGYHASMQQASEFFDGDLKVFADSLAQMPLHTTTQPVISQPQIAYQIWQRQQLLLKTANTPDRAIAELRPGFSEHNFDHQRWRVYVRALPSQDEAAATPGQQRWIMVAQPISMRLSLAEQLILAAVTPMVMGIPLIALMIWLIIRRGLTPLHRLVAQLRHKKADDLSPVTLADIPSELVTVQQTLNHLFHRLDDSFKREQRFASDAAHELRTPLSVLKVNVHNLKQELGEQHETLNHLSASVDRMAHVVDQILTLNRTNPEQFSQQFESVDLRAQAQQVIRELYPEIAQRRQNIELHGDKAWLQGNAFALRILLQNLLANASKYTPERGEIRVTVSGEREQVLLIVEDSGPGIADSERDKVFDRFYRVGGDRHDSAIIGCGLGLAIVQHIAQLHQASVQLSSSSSLQGLQVTLSFPLLPAYNAEQCND